MQWVKNKSIAWHRRYLYHVLFMTAERNILTPPKSWLVTRVTVYVTWIPWRALSGQHEDDRLNRQIRFLPKLKTEWHFQSLAARAISSRRPRIYVLESLIQKKCLISSHNESLRSGEPGPRGFWRERFDGSLHHRWRLTAGVLHWSGLSLELTDSLCWANHP